MLEFIVLGEIPGTHIHITFAQIIKFIFLVIAFGLTMYELHLRNIHIHKPKLQDIINRLAL